MPKNNEGNERFWENKWTFLAIVLFPILAGTVVVVLYVAGISTSVAVQTQELADLKNNDLTHIELEITEIQQQQTTAAGLAQTNNDKIVQALTILNQLTGHSQ